MRRSHTEGLAEAEWRAWLQKNMKTHDVSHRQLRVSAESSNEGEALVPVIATVQGPYSAGLIGFVQSIQQSGKAVKVERLEINQYSKPLYNLRLRTWYRLPSTDEKR